MCNRARMSHEPETIVEQLGADWLSERLTRNRADSSQGDDHRTRSAGSRALAERRLRRHCLVAAAL